MTAATRHGTPGRVLVTCATPERLLAWARHLPPGVLTVTNAFHGSSRLQLSTTDLDTPIEFVATTEASSVASRLVLRGRTAPITPETLPAPVAEPPSRTLSAHAGAVRSNLLDAVRALCQHTHDHPLLSGITVQITKVATTPLPIDGHGVHMPPWPGSHTIVHCGSIGELLSWYHSIHHEDVYSGCGPMLTVSRPETETLDLRLVALLDSTILEVHADASVLAGHIAINVRGRDTQLVRAERITIAMTAAAAESSARHQKVMAALGGQTPARQSGCAQAEAWSANHPTTSSGET